MAVAFGGALGAVGRVGVSLAIPASWPWATLVVNVIGSMLIGILLTAQPVPPLLRTFAAVGFCGAFTTFSTFSWQTLSLLEQGRVTAAFSNIAASLSLCLLAVFIGARLGRMIT